MRYFISLALGFVVAISLFGLMKLLVSGNDEAQVRPDDVQFVDFVRVKRDESVRTKDRQVPEKPQPPDKPPPPQMAAQQQDVRPNAPELDIDMPDIGASFAGSGPYLGNPFSGANMGDGDLIPIVQIRPQYPREALMKCIGGVVELRFTVLEDGSVTDASVISADPPRMFDREALRAIVRWKFKPRIVDGRPVQREATLPLHFEKPQGC
ncbi:MAG TPA: energy transducer TonB [Gammaproteobacteria bacterium]